MVHEHPYIEPINSKYRIVDWHGYFKDIEFDDLDFAEKILYAIRLYKGELDNELLESKMAESYD